MNENVRHYMNRFEQGIDRKDTDCVKWDNLKNVFGADNLLPMWVADTDFPCPNEVVEALRKKVDHGVFGYSFTTDAAYEAVQNKLLRDYNWKVEKEWIVFIDGIVGGLYSSVDAFTKPSDGVLIQQPVYFPFASAINDKSRKLINNSLNRVNGKYFMDFDHLEGCLNTGAEKDGDAAVKLAILCNPHNPVGRVWTKEELQKFGELCIANGVIVASDEIHCDILLNGNKFTPFATISKEFENCSITFMAASKTYNVAGLHQSFAVIPNKEIRDKFVQARCGLNWGNGFGLKAMEVSYNSCKDYNEALNEYIWDNYVYFRDFLKKRVPKISVVEPEGTYLLWVDFSATLKSEEEIKKLLIEECFIGANAGSSFGNKQGAMMRFNIGCSRKNLEQALMSLERVFG